MTIILFKEKMLKNDKNFNRLGYTIMNGLKKKI